MCKTGQWWLRKGAQPPPKGWTNTGKRGTGGSPSGSLHPWLLLGNGAGVRGVLWGIQHLGGQSLPGESGSSAQAPSGGDACPGPGRQRGCMPGSLVPEGWPPPSLRSSSDRDKRIYTQCIQNYIHTFHYETANSFSLSSRAPAGFLLPGEQVPICGAEECSRPGPLSGKTSQSSHDCSTVSFLSPATPKGFPEHAACLPHSLRGANTPSAEGRAGPSEAAAATAPDCFL